jgi:hypothetical protein
MVVGRNRADADRLAEYRTEQESLCHDCWTLQRDEERAASAQQAAETAAQAGLPVLQGTEKQIAWAETIRANVMKTLDAALGGSTDSYNWDWQHVIVLIPEQRVSELQSQVSACATYEDRQVLREQTRQEILHCDRMASTIRHNRARGTHSVDLMVNIVAELVAAGMSDAWICKHIGMDVDEILRLKQISGLAALFSDADFSRAWVKDQKEAEFYHD